MRGYVCRRATAAEMEVKWAALCKEGDPNWSVWKDEAIERVRKGESIAYYGFLNGRAICEATAMLEKVNVQNSAGLVDDKTAYLCAFRTVEEHRGKGFFSALLRFLLEDLKAMGYQWVTLGVEPTETENLQRYRHFGFTRFIKSAKETYPDGTVIDVDYYGMEL